MTRRSSSVTIRDVAKQAGVSVATVSRYINRNAPVSPEVAERLDKVMAELKYIPHAAARHLASRKTRVVGLLLTNMHNDFFAPLLNGTEQIVRKHGYNLLVATYHSDSRDSVPPPLGPHNTDGLLVFADSLTDEDLAKLHELRFPIVLIHRTPPASLPLPSVTVENKSASHKLVEHLIVQHGKKRILFLRGPIHQEDSYWRETGYRSALEAHGIPFDEDLVLIGEFERDVAYQALNRFLGNGRQVAFDAVFAGDDDAAIGVINALTDNGYRVPDDIAVVGFDDLRLSAFLSPPLTTVHAPTEAVGQIAAERLFGLLKNEISNGITLLPTEIIIRRSCGCQA
ncbi:MAG TPA: LacI family DNA-binding transcriptional regulator [Anaerolineales bacterium]|nr:LacI family DNA-binding transcriptional regulator [Anaerolineales bacterium]